MANVALGTTWNLPNYTGSLFTADAENTPLLTMMGGLTGGKRTKNQDFPTTQEFSYPTLAIPAIDETASQTAPTAISLVRSQVLQTTQIFHEQVALSYVRLANAGRLTATEVSTLGYGVYSKDEEDPVKSELDWQIAGALKHIARDFEYTMFQGSYTQAVVVTTDFQMRGLMECASDASCTVAAAGADLSKPLINELTRTMYAAGATFSNPVIFVNAFQKQQISDIYGYAPTDRNVGGVNIKQIETDVGNIGITLTRYMDTDDFIIVDMAYVAPVFQEVPGKGLLFYEPLSKTGAAETGQIFGMLSIDHGPKWVHGSITGLSTS